MMKLIRLIRIASVPGLDLREADLFKSSFLMPTTNSLPTARPTPIYPRIMGESTNIRSWATNSNPNEMAAEQEVQSSVI